MLYLLQLFLLAQFSSSPDSKADARPGLTISISGLKDTQHDLYIAVSRESEGFPDNPDMVKNFIISPAGQSRIGQTVSDLPYGRYAIMVYQDLNGNHKLDKNLLGIPSEPFAFSNNYRPKFRAPHWSECAFDYSPTSTTVTITILRM